MKRLKVETKGTEGVEIKDEHRAKVKGLKASNRDVWNFIKDLEPVKRAILTDEKFTNTNFQDAQDNKKFEIQLQERVVDLLS